jgi:integrase
MKSTRSQQSGKLSKPRKPYPEFPLFPHQTKRWAKKIRGKMCYFGSWDKPQEALDKYLIQKDDLHAGRTPKVQTEGFTIRDLCNYFLGAKRIKADNQEISLRSFGDYYRACQHIVDQFGKTRLVDDLGPDDFREFRFTLGKRLGHVALKNEIQRVRTIFKYAFDCEKIAKPIRFGPDFKGASQLAIDREKMTRGPRLFNADQIQKMLGTANPLLRAMLLLACNCGYGNGDVSELPMKALDLGNGWVIFPRPKTAIPRRCPLWPETIDAIQKAIALRPSPKEPEDAGQVFLTRFGRRWITHKIREKEEAGEKRTAVVRDDSVSKEMTKLLTTLNFKKEGLNFYTLRHVFETIGGEARDQPAVDALMGHVDKSMARHYRESISDDRLRAVVNRIHNWLFHRSEEA